MSAAVAIVLSILGAVLVGLWLAWYFSKEKPIRREDPAGLERNVGATPSQPDRPRALSSPKRGSFQKNLPAPVKEPPVEASSKRPPKPVAIYKMRPFGGAGYRPPSRV